MCILPFEWDYDGFSATLNTQFLNKPSSRNSKSYSVFFFPSIVYVLALTYHRRRHIYLLLYCCGVLLLPLEFLALTSSMRFLYMSLRVFVLLFVWLRMPYRYTYIFIYILLYVTTYVKRIYIYTYIAFVHIVYCIKHNINIMCIYPNTHSHSQTHTATFHYRCESDMIELVAWWMVWRRMDTKSLTIYFISSIRPQLYFPRGEERRPRIWLWPMDRGYSLCYARAEKTEYHAHEDIEGTANENNFEYENGDGPSPMPLCLCAMERVCGSHMIVFGVYNIIRYILMQTRRRRTVTWTAKQTEWQHRWRWT